MTKTLYDPLVEQRGIEKGIEKGKRQTAEKMLALGMDKTVIKEVTGLSEEEIEKLEAEK